MTSDYRNIYKRDLPFRDQFQIVGGVKEFTGNKNYFIDPTVQMAMEDRRIGRIILGLDKYMERFE